LLIWDFKMKRLAVFIIIFMLFISVFLPAISISKQQKIIEPNPIENNLFAHWKFDETDGNIAYDSSGNGYHGTVNGAQWTSGKDGGALEFDGSNDYVQITENTSEFNSYLETVGKGSISLWFKCDYIPTEHGITPLFYYGDFSPCTNMFDAANRGLIIEIGHSPVHHGSKWLYFTIFANGCTLPSFCYNSETEIQVGKWYHFVAVVGEDYNTGYLNGEEMTERHYNFGNSQYSEFFEDAVSHEVAWIGKGYWDAKNDPTPTVYYDGKIDDVRLYNKPLSAEEVLDLYTLNNDENLVGHWKFDENGGIIAYDSSGNDFHADVIGEPVWVEGMRGNALYFDGTNDYVEMPQDAVEYIGDLEKGTIAFWLNFENILQNQDIIPLFYIGIDNEYDEDDLFIIEIGHGTIQNTRLYVTWIIDQQIPVLCYDTAFNLEENKWYHFAVSVGPDGNTGFLNGEELIDRHYNFGDSTDDLFLDDIPVKEMLSVAYGKTNDMIDPYFRYFKGYMDDIRIYNKPLNETEIYEIYKENEPPYKPSEPDPENGSNNVNINKILSWTGGDPNDDPVTYDVYFGKESIPPMVADNISESIFDPGTLDYNTNYSWKIIAWDDNEQRTIGPRWSFKTKRNNSSPEIPEINGPTNGKAGDTLNYIVTTTDPDDDQIYYWVSWFDGCPGVYWNGPYDSGEPITFSYTYAEKGSFIIRIKAKDINDLESEWATIEVTIPRLRTNYEFFQLLLNRFPFLKFLLS
jgi:hypothetical protein